MLRSACLAVLLLAACRSSAPAPAESQFEMFSLSYASAQDVADQLTSLIERDSSRSGAPPIAVFQVDPRTNSVLVSASPEHMPTVRELVAKLDQRVENAAR